MGVGCSSSCTPGGNKVAGSSAANHFQTPIYSFESLEDTYGCLPDTKTFGKKSHQHPSLNSRQCSSSTLEGVLWTRGSHRKPPQPPQPQPPQPPANVVRRIDGSSYASCPKLQSSNVTLPVIPPSAGSRKRVQRAKTPHGISNVLVSSNSTSSEDYQDYSQRGTRHLAHDYRVTQPIVHNPNIPMESMSTLNDDPSMISNATLPSTIHHKLQGSQRQMVSSRILTDGSSISNNYHQVRRKASMDKQATTKGGRGSLYTSRPVSIIPDKVPMPIESYTSLDDAPTNDESVEMDLYSHPPGHRFWVGQKGTKLQTTEDEDRGTISASTESMSFTTSDDTALGRSTMMENYNTFNGKSIVLSTPAPIGRTKTSGVSLKNSSLHTAHGNADKNYASDGKHTDHDQLGVGATNDLSLVSILSDSPRSKNQS